MPCWSTSIRETSDARRRARTSWSRSSRSASMTPRVVAEHRCRPQPGSLQSVVCSSTAAPAATGASVVGLLDQRGEADACSRHRLLAAFAGLLLLFAQYPGGERGGFLGEDQVLQTRPLLHVAEGTLDESFTERLVNRL